ncbi:MAG: DUF302 domain-containing protein [Thiotrichaceae bacterium]|nr:DUF302 domain-containing protein [Thiotrichaceae bacterium]
MKHLLIIFTLVFLSTPVLANSKPDISFNIIKKESPYSVNETMDKFVSIIKKKGFTLFARIDHQENAASVDLVMNPAQVVIFGNPKGGTSLMNQDIRVALDLPLRIAVYQAKDDKVYISYHAPIVMASNYDLDGHPLIGKVTEGLDKLTSATIAE